MLSSHRWENNTDSDPLLAVSQCQQRQRAPRRAALAVHMACGKNFPAAVTLDKLFFLFLREGGGGGGRERSGVGGERTFSYP